MDEASRRDEELSIRAEHEHDSTSELPENVSEKEEQEYEDTAVRISYFHLDVATVLNIINGSIWGVLARKGLTVLTTYNGSYLGGLIWANFTACLVMGFLVHSSRIWRASLDDKYYSTKAQIPIYAGIATGFCGTCSSFSSVFLEAFNKSANTLPSSSYIYPNSAYGIMECIAVLIAQLGLSCSGFLIGKHLCEALDIFSIPIRLYKFLELGTSILGIVAYIIAIVLIGTEKSWRSWTFAIFFAPWGALLRFYLSKYLNGKFKKFPLGTFTANILGTLLLAVFALLSRGKSISTRSHPIVTKLIGCHVLAGLDDGFCGALTTVSTFVSELFFLGTLHSYVYGFVSSVLAYVIMILLLGSYNWTIGLMDPVCT